ncbi:MAG: D-alanyl-D-alanine carboxypeptidase/D-alanyl-D-alanine-endopeptidase [Acidobacteriota bacterium]
MKHYFRLFPLLFLALALFAGCSSSRIAERAASPDAEAFRSTIDSILARPIFRPTITTMKIVSLKTGEVLYERTPQLLMRPASNMKLLTTATALMRLGTSFAFTTRLYADGSVADSVLHGNLYIRGSGDPDLNSSSLAGMIASVRAKGIRAIDGDLAGDASYFDEKRWGTGWMWDDEPSGFAAFNSALSLNRNCVEVRVTPSDTIGLPPRVVLSPETAYMTVENTAVTSGMNTKSTLEVSRRFFERTNTITVSGAIPAGSRPRSELITVLYPEQYLLTAAKEELQRQGIAFNGRIRMAQVPFTAQLLAEHVQPIDSMIIFLNKVSDNLSAENTLKTISAEARHAPGSTEDGVSLVKETLAGFGIDSTAFLMVDGSGVSHYNLLTSEVYVKLLEGMYAQKNVFDLYYRSLPVAGVDGTLDTRMRNTPAQGNLHAKTGTISGVTTLAGYVTTADGEMLAFSMMMQNFIGSSEPYRRAQDAIGAFMAGYRRAE